MKIFNEEIDTQLNKVILTNDLFNLINEMQKNNKVLVLSPWTKVSDLLIIKKDNPLLNFLNENIYDFNELIHEKEFFKIRNTLEDKWDLNILDYSFNLLKILKSNIEIADDKISSKNLINILNFIDNYELKEAEIILVGFNEISGYVLKRNWNKINITIVTNNLKQTDINMGNLESLIIHKKEGKLLLQIYETDKFISWLESEIRMTIAEQDLSDYFNGRLTFNSFLIEKGLKNI